MFLSTNEFNFKFLFLRFSPIEKIFVLSDEVCLCSDPRRNFFKENFEISKFSVVFRREEYSMKQEDSIILQQFYTMARYVGSMITWRGD